MPTIEHHRIASRVRDERSRPPAQQGGGLSAGTLLIASVSSLAAALFVSRVWGAGTLAGAAVTPVVVALVAEALHRPRRAIESARRSRTAFDPLAEGRAGVREGDLEAARPVTTPSRVDHRVATRRPAGRRGLALGVATGAVAFALAAFALTGGELVLGDSAVSGGGRTTLFGGSRSSGATSDESTKSRDASPSTTKDRGTTQPPASGDGSSGTDTAPGGGTTQPGTSTGGGTGSPTDGGSTTTTPAPATPAPSPSGGTTTTPTSPATP